MVVGGTEVGAAVSVEAAHFAADETEEGAEGGEAAGCDGEALFGCTPDCDVDGCP